MTSPRSHAEQDPLAAALLPDFDVESSHAIRIRGRPDVIYAAARRFDISGSTTVRWLYRLRGLPASALNMDGLTGMGFKVLVEDRPHGFAFGLIGQFWRPTGNLIDFDPDEFTSFQRAGLAKAVCTFRVAPESEEDTRLSTTTRVLAMDEAARRRFLRYWRIVGPFSGLIRRRALRLVQAEVT